MFPGLCKAVYVLTVIPLRFSSYTSSKHQSSFLASFPATGLVLGGIGALCVAFSHPSLPVLCAWLIPTIWVFLSFPKSIIGLHRWIEILLVRQDDDSGSREQLSLPIAAATFLLLFGKIFALQQAEILSTETLSLVVFFVPVLSRYLSLVAVLDIAEFMQIFGESSVHKKIQVVLGSSLLVVAILAFSLTLGLLLLIAGFGTALTLRLVSEKKLSQSPAPLFWAIIEISELVMLWTAVICGTIGVNLTLFRLL